MTKIIINNYILNNDLSQEENLKLALKYQIFTKETSLFAEVELSNKISEKMKLEILGDKENNIIKKKRELIQNKCEEVFSKVHNNLISHSHISPKRSLKNKCSRIKCNNAFSENDINDIIPLKKISPQNYCANENTKKECKALKPSNNSQNNYYKKESDLNKKKEYNLNEKDSIMEMINTQDFIVGNWDENEFTKKIIEKYNKEYELLKGLKNKNINDKIALTILIIYFINKEHSDLLNDLLMIIKKAKNYIKNNTKDDYENIIKEIGLN